LKKTDEKLLPILKLVKWIKLL